MSEELGYTKPTIMWTTADNDNVEVTADDLHSIIGAAAVRSNMLHVKYRTLKEAVNQAKTIEEVNAITW